MDDFDAQFVKSLQNERALRMIAAIDFTSPKIAAGVRVLQEMQAERIAEAAGKERVGR